MESFLKLVAADLYKHTEGNLDTYSRGFFLTNVPDFSLMSISPKSRTHLFGRPHTSASANCSVVFLHGKWVIR